MIKKIFKNIKYRLSKNFSQIIPINNNKTFTSQRKFIDFDDHIIDMFVLADGAFIKRKKHNGLNDPVAHQWICNPCYGFHLSKGYINSKTGMLYLDSKKNHFTDTVWTWTRNFEKFNKKKIKTIHSKKPLYIFANQKYHGIFEDLAHILALIDLGFEFDIAISKTNKWMIDLLKIFIDDHIKIIFFDSFDGWIYADELFITTKSLLGEFINPFFLKKLNKAASDKLSTNSIDLSKYPKKIFISRQDSKNRIFDENDLISIYEKKEYEKIILSEISVKEQIILFQNLNACAGFHGAGFSNLVFGKNKIIVNEYYSRHHFNSCYSSISEYFGFDYQCDEIKNLTLPYS